MCRASTRTPESGNPPSSVTTTPVSGTGLVRRRSHQPSAIGVTMTTEPTTRRLSGITGQTLPGEVPTGPVTMR